MITLSKNNLDLHGKYIIHRLQNESFKCKSIHIGYIHTLALMDDGTLYAWRNNDEGQLGLGHNRHQNPPQKIEGRLERAFRLGHVNYKFLSMFSQNSPENRINFKKRLVSQHVSINEYIEEITAYDSSDTEASPSSGQT